MPPGADGEARGRVFGVLLRGPSGAGKSDLALRLIDRGWRLVADDQTLLRPNGGALQATAPEPIAGRIEVRGLGILAMAAAPRAELCLVVDLVAAEHLERLPEVETRVLRGVRLRRLALDPFEASAPAKLQLVARREADAIMAATRPAGEARESTRRGSERNMPDGIKAADGRGGAAAPETRRIVLVTGLSGAGRSLALDILEDLGYEAIDNPPLELLAAIVGSPAARPIALGVDIRTRDFAVEPFLEQLDRLHTDPALTPSLLFIDCDEEVLRRRYTETRRSHPLAQGRPLKDGITAERRLVAPLRDRADLVVDTSAMTPGEFRQFLTGHLDADAAAGMAVFVTSFAYRHGLPRAADLVFDVRFLRNPHYDPALRELTGCDPEVADFVGSDPDFLPFFTRMAAMLRPLLPRFEREGKSYLTVALGCTGGRHRSVMTAERLAEWLKGEGCRVTLVHRDLATLSDRP
jgi:RNase adaptor protein for sRNA GlmZ degradation